MEQTELLEKLFENRKALSELKNQKKDISEEIKVLVDTEEKLLRLIRETMPQ